MESLADTIARHALAVLLGMATLMLGMTHVLWRSIERHGASLGRLVVGLWNALRSSRVIGSLRGIPGLGHMITHTMTAARYLGVYALIAFAASLTLVALFFALADEIGIDEDFARFDSLLAQALATHLSREFLQIIAMITHLGDRNFLTAIVIVVMIALLVRRDKLLAAAWVIATSCGALLNSLLKVLFERARPVHEHGVVFVEGWSFPSGHASGAMLVYGLLAYIVVRHTPAKWHLPVAIVSVALIVFVGFSRVLLQVHYLSDVLAGYASAAAWTTLCIAGLETARWRAKAANGNG
ncbi:undecaprenyl-diphosphatase [Povalibacter uvarum]|uniref:undecaprenyl-diphosphate phosphatase n=1 Tax=Povalibacter uvarum TaxID=732238 RepID=A0A841HS09_9GAMM|nr:phosphatase PAP2 family protein [Povalibacter uvarum]MBB6095553.1 undecaprenyl-diphosphatase [Povalibacter uvarum]